MKGLNFSFRAVDIGRLRRFRWMGVVALPLCIASSLFADSESIVIDVSDYRYSDINTIPRYPIEGVEARVRITAQNQSNRDVSDLSLIVSVDGKEIATLVAEVEAEGVSTVEVPWKPSINGWANISVRAISESLSAEVSASIEVPVVTRQFYFQWFTRNWDEDRGLRWANMVQFRGKDESVREYWDNRGFLVYPALGWKKPRTPEQFTEYLEKAADQYGGFVYDELGGYDDQAFAETPSMVGLKNFLENNPKSFSAVYAMGSLKPTLLNMVRRERFEHEGLESPEKTGIDLLLVESYFNYQVTSFNSYTRYKYFDQRIDMARDFDVLEYSIMVLGYAGVEDPSIDRNGRGPHVVTEYELEDQVRYIRRMAPEMPGIGFYGHPNSKDHMDWEGIQAFADELCLKYFVNPVLTIWARDLQMDPVVPEGGDTVTLFAAIHNIGGMDAADVVVTFYHGDPRSGGTVIGEPVQISRVFSGKGMPEGINEVIDHPMPPGRYQVSQEWEAVSGYHEIFVTIESSDGLSTILDGMASRDVYVAP
ncbi:MAG: hypothetical protein ACQKBT_06920 [Puniceicoccales bacterium]